MRAELKNNKSCEELWRLLVSSPIGEMEILCCVNGLHLVKQCGADDTKFSPDERHRVEILSISHGSKAPALAEECVEWLRNYFAHGIAEQDIPALCPSIIDESSFRGRAWRLLPKSVPFGTKLTYLQLARLCGNAQACRAAGSAMSSNPISLIIPCHRVIPSSGGVGNYSGGKKNLIKSWLLDFEKKKHSCCN